jgi:membrane protein DedA with SNARE-associated domain
MQVAFPESRLFFRRRGPLFSSLSEEHVDRDEVKFTRSVIFRFLGYLRPYLRLVIGAALMGVGKFTLPLAFPLAFKYVIDVLLTSPAKFDRMMLLIDRWCS